MVRFSNQRFWFIFVCKPSDKCKELNKPRQTMHVFYAQDISGDLVLLDAEESRHSAKVLRIRPGQEVAVTDGSGQWCRAVVESSHPRSTGLRITGRQQDYRKRTFHLHMAVAPTKNIDRFEWFLEKATECGIDEITPLLCHNSERHTIRHERLNKIMIAAMKQSMRAWLPKLNPLEDALSFFQKSRPEQAFIAHCGDGEKHHLRNMYRTGENALIVVGPEGDFSGEELRKALSNGFQPISLGTHRLRTETAAVVLCVQTNFINETF